MGLVHTPSNSFHHQSSNARIDSRFSPPWRHRGLHQGFPGPLSCNDCSSRVRHHSTLHRHSGFSKSSPCTIMNASIFMLCSNRWVAHSRLEPNLIQRFCPVSFPRSCCVTRAIHGSSQPPDNTRWFVCFKWRFDIQSLATLRCTDVPFSIQ